MVAQWNQGTETVAHEEVAILDGVRVGSLNCYAERYEYQVSYDVDAPAEALRMREKLLASLKAGKTRDDGDLRLRVKAQQWREMALDYLGELCDLQLTFDSVNQRYFDSQTSLFPASAHALLILIE